MSRRRRRAGEAGFALPTVLFVMLGAFAIGSVAAIASIGAQKGTTRDHNTKTAIAAAEAGVSQALLRYNRFRSGGTTSNCLVVVGDSATLSEQLPGPDDGWCEGVEGRTTDGGQFTYWVKPIENRIEIVSQGSADVVTRRVEVTATSKPQPVNPFADATLIGLLGIDLANNVHVAADVATNQQIGLGNNATLACAAAQVGEGYLNEPFDPNDGTATCTPTDGEILLTPVNQGDVPTNNSNWRFFEWDPISGNRGNVDWDPDARELTLHQNSALTLGGSNYSLCKLTMRNRTTLYIAAAATVNIFFDSPGEGGCDYENGETQFRMEPNSAIKPNGGASVALLFVGDGDLETNIDLQSNTHQNSTCGQSFVIYAPRTNIAMSGNAQFCGAMAGERIDMQNNTTMTPSHLAEEFALPNEEMWSPYWRDSFVECSGPAGEPPTEPNHGC